ncbi:hypothetical protein ACTXPA_17610 [Glutamicibacter arilaitensis]|uniref:hypothetical protein n=1 Tax=Glutamicibacter arilaitensis TaxID=256701 RepID=UPI003FCFD463
MQPIELTARREALGLGLHQLADYLKVRHQNIARWESGTYEPKDWGFINEALTELEDFQADLVAVMVSTAVEARDHSEPPGLVTFGTDQEYWRWFPQVGARRIPVTVHHVATARAASLLRVQLGLSAEISAAPEEL